MPPRRDASQAAAAAAPPSSDGGGAAAQYSRLDKPPSSTGSSGARRRSSRLCWTACLLPLLVLLFCLGAFLLLTYLRLAPGQSFALMTGTRFVDRPSNTHSRWRREDYLAKYPDRFFFQWFNFLLYDAETGEHFTVVFHTTHHSARAVGPPFHLDEDVATASFILRQKHELRLEAHESIRMDSSAMVKPGTPEADTASVVHGDDWGLDMYRPNSKTGAAGAGAGAVGSRRKPVHRMIPVDDDTYRLELSFLPEHVVGGSDAQDVVVSASSSSDPAQSSAAESDSGIELQLTFTRIHGVYSGLDSEQGNIDQCAIVSSLFGYNSRLSAGFLRVGARRIDLGALAAASPDRFRAYAAGSWGCQLPGGSPAMSYPWTWSWVSIPGDAHATPPRPEIGISAGTAMFQTNSSIAGDLYGGYAHIGIGDEPVVATTMARFRHNTSLPLPLVSSSSDGQLRRFDMQVSDWTDWSDAMGSYSLPLSRTYDVETAHYRLQLRFGPDPDSNSTSDSDSKSGSYPGGPAGYYRCLLPVERLAPPPLPGGEATRLQAYSDFRTVGVPARVQLWHRSQTPELRVAHAIHSRHAGGSSLPDPPASVSDATEWRKGGWERVVFDGEVRTHTALEFAFEAPLNVQGFDAIMRMTGQRQKRRDAESARSAGV